MRWEKRELQIILSARHTVAADDHFCEVCGLPIYAGQKCFSYGIADRKHSQMKRLYTCCDLDAYTAPIERWMYDNRMLEEVFLSD